MRLRAAVWAMAVWSLAGAALAFGNPQRFAAEIDVGGGGGRFFTGSARDSYACGVCHGQIPLGGLVLEGAPWAGFVPGAAYRLVIRWPAGLSGVALNLEITDPDGLALGTLVVPPADQRTVADLCTDPEQAGVEVFASADGRQIATVAACGMQQATVDWIAPVDPAPAGLGLSGLPPAWLSAGVVAENDDDDWSGDAVVELSGLLMVAGQGSAETGVIEAYPSCSAAPRPLLGAAAAPWMGFSTLLLLSSWALMRRK